MSGDRQCPICRRRFRSPADRAAHECALTDGFFRAAVARWQAAGVNVRNDVNSDDDGRDAAREEQDRP